MQKPALLIVIIGGKMVYTRESGVKIISNEVLKIVYCRCTYYCGAAGAAILKCGINSVDITEFFMYTFQKGR